VSIKFIFNTVNLKTCLSIRNLHQWSLASSAKFKSTLNQLFLSFKLYISGSLVDH